MIFLNKIRLTSEKDSTGLATAGAVNEEERFVQRARGPTVRPVTALGPDAYSRVPAARLTRLRVESAGASPLSPISVTWQ